MTQPAALIVEDDRDFRESVAALVAREGFEVAEAGTLEDARKKLLDRPFDVILLDLSLPDGDGLELLAEEHETDIGEFVVMTGNVAADSAIAALRAGALDYLQKPVDRSRLKTILTNVSRTRELKRESSGALVRWLDARNPCKRSTT